MGVGEPPPADQIHDPQGTLIDIGHCTLRAEHEEHLWNEAVEILRQSFAVDCVGALRCSSDGNGLELVAASGADQSLRGQRLVAIGQGTVTDSALDSDEPLVVEDTRQEKRFTESPLGERVGCRSALVLAVSVGAKHWGVCEFHWRRPQRTSRARVDFAASVVSLLGEALARLEREQLVRERWLRLREQLRQSQKLEALGLLAGGVAHDFNNHLTVIKGYSELLLAGMEDTDSRRPQVEKVRDVSLKAQRLADQLLTFSRQKVRQPVVFDLNEVLVNLRDMLESLIGGTITIELDISEQPIHVELDPSDIEQVILNLAVNARDAIEGTGKIILSTRTAEPEELTDLEEAEELGEDAVVLQVTDTGRGMADDVRERVFEPFFTTKGAQHGTGLGLATVCRIVTEAGGKIIVNSTLGEGTSFALYFPHSEPPERQQAERNVAPDDLWGDEVILVIEDDPDVLEYITDVLEQHGYDSIPCSDGQKAVETLRMFYDSIDAVICDVILPNLTPEELREELLEEFPKMPIVMTSGFYVDYEQLMGDGDLGNVPFVSKPLAAADLLQQLRSVLDGEGPTLRLR